MAKVQRHTEPGQRQTPAHHDGKKHTDRERHTRESGRWGADEPDYGRPRHQRPDPEPHGGPNRHGPQYEEGGRYPGTREISEHTPLRSRSADPGQGSYGGFKNQDPGYQRQQRPRSNKR